ncbi:hypothetical protein TTHERM_00881500 (macronuclear) [Tetrahymena thermophila SB210]|uniref:Uncharacterized protein n=1 Tax=Tetrahymena thermophila (strain SB210) TaxID=312017 RepID=Q23GY8_TETTS|nr:hypothetical protein TTHERM_00881500 [Tetrahymena thermophila SB210]EAR95859.1 hypothetical protein TTHERM_00881500 [Tetrahymena thermophila SB210]|eukprot:XP_001016104.1 hypothetical protein TTHERM_00881500 [Tetrahymena thermophila SB210]
MGCIISLCKKKQIQAPESEVASIHHESYGDINELSGSTPKGYSYFNIDYRNENYFYTMQRYEELKSNLSQIINENVNNKLTREDAEPILDQLRIKFQNYKNQIQEERRRYTKYVKEFNYPQKISEIHSEHDIEKSGATQAEVKTLTITPAERAERIQAFQGTNQSSKTNAYHSINDQNGAKQSAIDQNSHKFDDLQQQSTPIKNIKAQSNATEFNENLQNNRQSNRKSNFDDSKNLTKDKKAEDSFDDECQISEMLQKNLLFTDTNQNPLNVAKRRQTEKLGSIKNGESSQEESSNENNASQKKNFDLINKSNTISSSAPLEQQLKHQNILKNFQCEKINLLKPKQIIIDIQQGTLITTPSGLNLNFKILVQSKQYSTVQMPDNELKFFQAFQINLNDNEDLFKVQLFQGDKEFSSPQTFQISELTDQKIHIKNIHFKLDKSNVYVAILIMRVQYIHNLHSIQKYWIDETDARIKQIDQIKNFISSRKIKNTNNNAHNTSQNTLNNIQTLLTNEFNSHSEDGSSYFDNQFYAK